MLSSLLRSPTALQVNVEIMRAFVQMRRLIGTPGERVPTEAELARQQNRDYEPASALLERIRTERNSQSEIGKPTRASPRSKAKPSTKRKKEG